MGFLVEKTTHTPEIRFEDGKLTIKGRSIPEDSIGLYQPLFDYITEYIKSPLPLTEVEVMLEYVNSSTNRALASIFEIFNELDKNKNKVMVRWYYLTDDREMYELGLDFKEITGLPFSLIEVQKFPDD
jgi:hypothetical protein